MVDPKIASNTLSVFSTLYDKIVEKWPEKDALKNFTGTGIRKEELEPTAEQSRMLLQAEQILQEGSIENPYEIKVARFMQKHVHGLASNDIIYISENAFDKGLQWVTSVILEEYIHNKHNCRDETRQMQDVLIDYWLNAIKKHSEIKF
jgi:hypothetical protein